jgi:hypothetical protein
MSHNYSAYAFTFTDLHRILVNDNYTFADAVLIRR